MYLYTVVLKISFSVQVQAHELHPVEFPVVLSRQLYLVHARYMRREVNMLCDKHPYVRKKLAKKIRGISGLRTCCEVLVYITPPECHTWKLVWNNKTLIEELLTLIPGKIMDISIPGGLQDWSEVRSIRSMDFIILVGPNEVGFVPINSNLMTKLVVDKGHGKHVSVPTKIFIPIKENLQGDFQVSGMYLVTSPSSAEVRIGLVRQHERIYQFAELEEMLSVAELEHAVWKSIHKSETLWWDVCTTCASGSGYVTISELTYLRNLREAPDKEFIFLNILFPNSSIISGVLFYYYHGHLHSSILIRVPHPVNGTLLFRPISVNDGYHFLTCYSILDAGPLSLFGLLSAYDFTTWIWIILALLATPTLLISLGLRVRLSEVVINSVSILLEQGCFENILKRSRWIGGVCLLMGVVLSNIYKGDNITSLTAPRPPQRLEQYEQLFLRNFTYFVSIHFAHIFSPVFRAELNKTGKGITGNIFLHKGFTANYWRHFSGLDGGTNIGENELVNTILNQN